MPAYKVTGPVRLVVHDGGEWRVPAGESVALCRCGQSGTKPFCDRSHRAAGFAFGQRAPRVLGMSPEGPSGGSTRAVHAAPPAAGQGEPFLPPTFAAPYHLRGDADPAGYGRFANPTWERLEAAIAELEGGEVVAPPPAWLAVTAVLLTALGAGDVLVALGDAYLVSATSPPGTWPRAASTCGS